MKKLVLAFSILFLATAGFSQVQQARWWYFGSGAGLDFNTSPTADPNGTLATYEGCSSISSPIGTLYFYTDGSIVKNANHATMTNGTGLTGGGSSTQSGQVIPYPGSSVKYIIFTQAQNVGANGMRYSVVDMTMSSGMGAVTSTKNVFLNNSFAEKICGVKKAGGYWVCALKLPGDTMYAYEVTAAGVNHTPVKSNTGINLATNNFYGCMKANVQGTQIAAAHQGILNAVHVFNFNKTTGQVSSTMTISITQSNPYGVEFSPNGNLLYVQSWNQADVKQYDMTAGTATQISNSQVTLGSGTGGGSLQMGPDGLMYGARFGQTVISSISSPDVQGTGAGFTAAGVSLSTGDISRWGLPLFLGSFFGASIQVDSNCVGDVTTFTADTTNVDSMSWNFGDPLSGANNTAAGLLTVDHLYTDTGLYTVTLVIFNGNYSDTVLEEVYIYPRQTVEFGPDDTTLCRLGVWVIDVDQPHAEYVWQDGSTDSAYIVAYPDSFVSVTINGHCDTVSDTVYIDYSDYPLDIVDDTFFCSYDTLFVSTGLIGSAFVHQWNTGSQSSSINVTTPGTYAVTVTDENCVYIDSATYQYYPEVEVDLGNDSVFCYDPLVNLSPKSQSNAVTYEWASGTSNGSVISTSYNIDVVQTDKYYVTVTDGGGFCQAVDSVEWKLWFEPIVNLGNDTSFCHNDILTIDPFTQSAFPMTYSWNDNSNNPTLKVNLVGLYWVEVSDANCSIRDTIIVDQYPKLDVNLGEDINTCDGKTVTLNPVTTLPVLNYKWSDGSGNSQLKITEHGTYGITVNNDLCSAYDVVNVFYHNYPEINIGPDTSICPGDQIFLDASTGSEITEYYWSTGNRSPLQEAVARDGQPYWVEAMNVACRSVDSILIKTRKVPNMDLGADTNICEGSEMPVGVIYDPTIQSYRWNTDDSAQTVTITEPGDYSVIVNDGYCDTEGKITIGFKDVPSQIDFKLDAPGTICVGERVLFELYDPRFKAYEWQDGSTSSRYEVQSEGLYYVKATHDCGFVTDTAFIDKCECPIWFPTAFNPDGDYLNDNFVASSDCDFLDYEFKVYNRWGEEVFNSIDPTESWDGSYKGQKCPEGAYSYKLVFKADHEGERIIDEKSGSVLLLR